MHASAAALLLALLAPAATAAWGLKFEVWNGSAWVSSIIADPGNVVRFRVGSYFDIGTQITTADGTGAAAQLNRFTGSNIWTNFENGKDVLQNLVRTLPNGGTTVVSVTGNRIGGLAATSFASNLLLGPLPAEPVTYDEIYQGEINLSSDVHSLRVLTFQSNTFGVSPNTKGLTFYNYGSATNKLSAQPDGARTDLNATINMLPAPGPLMVLGLASLAVFRRRA